MRILIFRIDFSDLPSHQIADESFSKLTSNISQYYGQVSQGKLTFTWKISDEVVRMPYSVEQYEASDRSNPTQIAHIIEDAQILAFSRYQKSNFDYIIIAPPRATTQKEISTSISYLENSNSFLKSTILAGDYWQSGEPWTVPAHELGHSLGLIDLYSSSASDSEGGTFSYLSQFKFMGPFDLMNWPTGPAPELTAWNRLAAGFLSPNEIRCLPKTTTVSKLSPIEISSGEVKALFLKLDDFRFLVIENRQALGFDQKLSSNVCGAVIYLVDVNIGSGNGPMRFVNSLSPTVKAGQRISAYGFIVEVLAKDDNKLYVLVRASSLPAIEKQRAE